MARVNHYKYLDKHMPSVFTDLGLDMNRGNSGIVAAHGDKTSQYKDCWAQVGIPFEHGCAIYLLSYVSPYSEESRQTKNGWVPPEKWVTENYTSGHAFKNVLPDVDKNDPDILSPF